MVDRFPIVFHGYDKEKVDEAINASQESLNRLRE